MRFYYPKTMSDISVPILIATIFMGSSTPGHALFNDEPTSSSRAVSAEHRTLDPENMRAVAIPFLEPVASSFVEDFPFINLPGGAVVVPDDAEALQSLSKYVLNALTPDVMEEGEKKEISRRLRDERRALRASNNDRSAYDTLYDDLRGVYSLLPSAARSNVLLRFQDKTQRLQKPVAASASTSQSSAAAPVALPVAAPVALPVAVAENAPVRTVMPANALVEDWEVPSQSVSAPRSLEEAFPKLARAGNIKKSQLTEILRASLEVAERLPIDQKILLMQKRAVLDRAIQEGKKRSEAYDILYEALDKVYREPSPRLSEDLLDAALPMEDAFSRLIPGVAVPEAMAETLWHLGHSLSRVIHTQVLDETGSAAMATRLLRRLQEQGVLSDDVSPDDSKAILGFLGLMDDKVMDLVHGGPVYAIGYGNIRDVYNMLPPEIRQRVLDDFINPEMIESDATAWDHARSVGGVREEKTYTSSNLAEVFPELVEQASKASQLSRLLEVSREILKVARFEEGEENVTAGPELLSEKIDALEAAISAKKGRPQAYQELYVAAMKTYPTLSFGGKNFLALSLGGQTKEWWAEPTPLLKPPADELSAALPLEKAFRRLIPGAVVSEEMRSRLFHLISAIEYVLLHEVLVGFKEDPGATYLLLQLQEQGADVVAPANEPVANLMDYIREAREVLSRDDSGYGQSYGQTRVLYNVLSPAVRPRVLDIYQSILDAYMNPETVEIQGAA